MKLLILLLIISGVVLRLLLINERSIPFPQDMGRDLLWSKDIVFYKELTLIGPAASIWGVYFGPFWYYFLSIPLLISGGNPYSAVFATMATIVVLPALSEWMYRKYLNRLQLTSLAVILLFTFGFVKVSIFAFHANVLPFLTLISIYFLFLAKVKNPQLISISFLSASFMFSADPAPAAVTTFTMVIMYFWLKIYKKQFLKTVALSAVLFAVPLVPQILFELRNEFVQSKSLIAYFKGDNPSLSGQMPLIERTYSRIVLFFNFAKDNFFPLNSITAALILVAQVVGNYMFFKNTAKGNSKILYSINIIFLFLNIIIFTLFVTVEVKEWYLYGLFLPFSFCLMFSLSALKDKPIIIAILLALISLVNLNAILDRDLTVGAQNDPANLHNQLEAMKTIYHDASISESSVYIYTPTIYDLQYQYLFWWQGERERKGYPIEFAYLPNTPNYVFGKEKYHKRSEVNPTYIYLIVEKSAENEFYSSKSWLSNFESYEGVWQKEVNNSILVKKMIQDEN